MRLITHPNPTYQFVCFLFSSSRSSSSHAGRTSCPRRRALAAGLARHALAGRSREPLSRPLPRPSLPAPRAHPRHGRELSCAWPRPRRPAPPSPSLAGAASPAPLDRAPWPRSPRAGSTRPSPPWPRVWLRLAVRPAALWPRPRLLVRAAPSPAASRPRPSRPEEEDEEAKDTL